MPEQSAWRETVAELWREVRSDERPVIAIDLRRSQRFALHRQDALALFAGTLRDELFDPVAQRAAQGPSSSA